VHIPRLAGLLLALLALSGLPAAAPTAAAPPAGFDGAVVPGLTNLDQPTAFDFLPDGSMLIATQPGRLLLYQGGALRGAPVFDKAGQICSNFERGLLGVTVDPDFATSRAIFVYYTFNRRNSCEFNGANQPANRVSRLRLTPELTVEREDVLIDNIPSPNGNHNAGDLHVGKDGLLYISTGDGGANAETSRQRYTLAGKILRVTRDGAIPADNPYQGAGTARCNATAEGTVEQALRCQEIFAYGFRNPFRIAFDPNAAGTRFFINDVGAGAVEEISEGRNGGDFGWSCFEGARVNSTSGMCQGVQYSSTVAPAFQYRRDNEKPPSQPAHFDGCASITGGAFVPNGQWPASYDGAYLFGDYVCGRIFARFADGSTSVLESSASSVTHIAFGPDGSSQALYYASRNGRTISRIRYTGATNRSPAAQLTVTPTFGSSPLQVTLDASGSSDPDEGDSIAAYLWRFGDGTTAETTTPTTTYTYRAKGVFTAEVRVRDNRGAVSANPATARVDVDNEPPTATIAAPAAGARFSVGEPITLRGSAVDPEDGALPGARLSWEVRRHHDDHFHPYLSATGAEATLAAPGPEDLAAVDTSWLEVRLTATDAAGRVSEVVTRELRPRIVSLRLETSPPGLRVSVNDSVSTTTLAAPAAVRSWPGWSLTLSAPANQQLGGVTMKLCGWRHGGAPSHAYTTPAADTTLRAIFVPAAETCPAQVGVSRAFLPLVRR
jgi:glucose/arabinose dehydrogenase